MTGETHPVERITTWIGSTSSLVLHTVIFVVFFALSFAGFLTWSLMFLILTTAVSLEAIYLAIFIQMTVNRHTKSLSEVEQNIDEIQEDVEEISEDVEEMQEGFEEMTEDQKEEERKRRQAQTLELLTADVRKVLADLEALKQRQ